MAGRAHVVTRNAHVDDIRAFLAAHGLEDLPVHRVKRPASKAVVVCDPRWAESAANAQTGADDDTDAHDHGYGGDDAHAADGAHATAAHARPALPPRRPVLFVDDNIAEHLDPSISAADGVVRFLFARTTAAAAREPRSNADADHCAAAGVTAG